MICFGSNCVLKMGVALSRPLGNRDAGVNEKNLSWVKIKYYSIQKLSDDVPPAPYKRR